jgi:uncharacterized protein (DUF302 family)
MTPEGLTIIESHHGPHETADRLAAAINARGMALMARIDHAAAAAKVGLELRPTEVLLFGSPRVGSQMMQSVQTVGIDLPLRVLVWQDAAGATWLGYNDPGWIARRHGAEVGVVDAMTQGLEALAREATGADNP